MTPYEERLTDDLDMSLRESLRILNREVSRIGKPAPTLHQVAAIRAQVSQAMQQVNELFGAMSARPK